MQNIGSPDSHDYPHIQTLLATNKTTVNYNSSISFKNSQKIRNMLHIITVQQYIITTVNTSINNKMSSILSRTLVPTPSQMPLDGPGQI